MQLQEQIAAMTKSLRALITKHSIKDRLRTAYTYLNKLKHLCEDVSILSIAVLEARVLNPAKKNKLSHTIYVYFQSQHTLPDVFIWLISNGKRLAYHRIPARDIIYSDFADESGKYCGKMQTLFLKVSNL